MDELVGTPLLRVWASTTHVKEVGVGQAQSLGAHLTILQSVPALLGALTGSEPSLIWTRNGRAITGIPPAPDNAPSSRN